MKKSLFHAAALACALAAAGCHARWFPLASAPGYPFRTEAVPAVLEEPASGRLSGDAWATAFRYQLPARGALLVSAAARSSAPLQLEIYGGGDQPLAHGEVQPETRLTAPGLTPGPVYVLVKTDWRDPGDTRFSLSALFKPDDPDQANGALGTPAGARPLAEDEGLAADSVDYSAMRRTHFWRIGLPGEGALTLKFETHGRHLSAELESPGGGREPIDPSTGLAKADLPAGDYLVRVTADEAGDKGEYRLSTRFKPADACKNGGPACAIEGAEALAVPADSKTADVDFARSRQFHFYKVALKERGRLTIVFKILDPHAGSKVAAFLLRSPVAEGEPISGPSKTVDLDPGDVYLKVQATRPGDFARYAVTSVFQPASYISGDVVEIQRRPTCLLTVSAGSNQGVRTAAGCTVVSRAGAPPTGACVVAEVYPNLSKIRPLEPGCRVTPTAKVQIAAQ